MNREALIGKSGLADAQQGANGFLSYGIFYASIARGIDQ